MQTLQAYATVKLKKNKTTIVWKAYGVIHYLYYSLLDQYSFPVKKLHHKTISHLFSRVADIRGHKDNLSVAKKTPNKFSARCT
jgi:hypothetical protein